MSSNPQIKFENSPADSLADSFVSTPGDFYPLFEQTGSMAPSGVMTPPDVDDESMFDQSMSGSTAGTPAPEKRSTKKRKSWGQQLPEPKTNLPPRKRAKTEDEKEQRRVERVLRNRRAAQSSRERKRQEVEALEEEKRIIERRNHDLEMRLADAEAKNLLLQQELAKMGGNMTIFNASSPSGQVEPYRRTPSPITLSQELFSSHDAHTNFEVSFDHTTFQASQTVNPASLSPEIRPVTETSNASSSDMTQHPAAMLCDLQCQSEEQRPWMPSTTSRSISAILTCLALISVSCSTILQPLSLIINSLRTRSSLSPTSSILTTIIWLVTTPSPLMTASTSTTSSTKTPKSHNVHPPRFSLRLNLLRRLLACSPQLARPLMDATMAALRSASEQQSPAQNCLSGSGVTEMRLPSRVGVEPSVPVLLTLLWATRVIDRERTHQERASRQKVGDMKPTNEEGQWSMELQELFRARNFRETQAKATKPELSLWEKKSLLGRWELHPGDH